MQYFQRPSRSLGAHRRCRVPPAGLASHRGSLISNKSQTLVRCRPHCRSRLGSRSSRLNSSGIEHAAMICTSRVSSRQIPPEQAVSALWPDNGRTYHLARRHRRSRCKGQYRYRRPRKGPRHQPSSSPSALQGPPNSASGKSQMRRLRVGRNFRSNDLRWTQNCGFIRKATFIEKTVSYESHGFRQSCPKGGSRS